MRRLFLAIPLLIASPCFAQQAANPVEPFQYGQRVGTAKHPLTVVLSSVIPSASAQSGQAAAPVELFSYGQRVGTQSNPLTVTLSGSTKTVSLQCLPTATLKAMTVPNGTLGCVSDLAGASGSTYSNFVFYLNGGWVQASWGNTL